MGSLIAELLFIEQPQSVIILANNSFGSMVWMVSGSFARVCYRGVKVHDITPMHPPPKKHGPRDNKARDISKIPWVDYVSEEPRHDGFTELLYPPVVKDRCCPELHLKNDGLMRPRYRAKLRLTWGPSASVRSRLLGTFPER